MAILNSARRVALRTLLAAPIAGTASIAMPQSEKARSDLDRGPVNLLDFIPASLHPAIAAGTQHSDLAKYFQDAAMAAAARNDGSRLSATIFVPDGCYRVSSVGLRDTVFRGESRDGTVIRAVTSGGADEFLFDAMLDRDKAARNTSGNGWVENMTLDAGGSGRSCLRTYGGGVRASALILRGGTIGLSAGLPIWATFDNIYAVDNEVGFHTFAAKGDGGTSTNFRACWALRSKRYGFHIGQLSYSSLVNCAGQDSGVANFFVEGDANGAGSCEALQLIGCGSEGTGSPFHFKRCRHLSVIGPRVVSPDPGRDYIVMEDSGGAIREFSGAPSAPAFGIGVRNHGAGDGAILVEGSDVTFDPDMAQLFTLVGTVANGINTMMTERMAWRSGRVQIDAALSAVGDVPFLEFTHGKDSALALTGGSVILGAEPLKAPARMLRPGQVAIEIDSTGSGLILRFKDRQGRLRAVRLPALPIGS
ncbi:hypothetical protein OMP43_03070 [Sphingomonas sp. CBMAI 2297]|uniref:hypothetical protein n=1 Tax=Sphingomonas sp. CBMAI 2297 TaxID=2991720 RepID=UPI00245797B0|nr:hypothetical protein [Sphingomonas sp. CBMAI 2297]MDH4742995.1 hypothetical protein [Sphingomonas sp. CBMAI 2297]